MKSHGTIKCAHAALLPISELKQHPKNPNKHSQEQLAVYAAIMKYSGVRQPVRISNLSGFVTKGHGQALASPLNGWDHVPVEYQDYDSEEQEYADMVADNGLARQADMDYSMINAEIPNFGPDFDLPLLGIPGFTVDPAERMPPAPPSGGAGDPVATPSGESSAVTKIILFYTQAEYMHVIENANELCRRRGYKDLSEAFGMLIKEALEE